MVSTYSIASSVVFLINFINGQSLSKVPPYVKQCHEADPKLMECFISALHHLRPYLATGITEIELPSVEPFRMDELSLSLTGGPSGFKVTLADIDIYGASNFTVTKIRLGEKNQPFEGKIRIPSLRIDSKYRSSGILIILPASGNGTFHAKFENILATVKGTTSFNSKSDNNRYLNVDSLNIDLLVGKVNMGVTKVFGNNRLLTEATNLFLRENGHEVLKIMSPQLTRKLATVFQSIANKLLTYVPVSTFLVPGTSIKQS
ncbi:uncharacterized protein LOC108734160 isoform X2 [Agrilus planipennis]|uniref:Uncharacterized protein LOC108734160 isoform X2 n=1 Tax=Agrilus planipennis TaxID=224129 RepID=A0A7F5RFB0_AGRPL|nr:uncharacterized protein LOC108734160 isoform X2 [Agrilus planipennis]